MLTYAQSTALKSLRLGFPDEGMSTCSALGLAKSRKFCTDTPTGQPELNAPSLKLYSQVILDHVKLTIKTNHCTKNGLFATYLEIRICFGDTHKKDNLESFLMFKSYVLSFTGRDT